MAGNDGGLKITGTMDENPSPGLSATLSASDGERDGVRGFVHFEGFSQPTRRFRSSRAAPPSSSNAPEAGSGTGCTLKL